MQTDRKQKRYRNRNMLKKETGTARVAGNISQWFFVRFNSIYKNNRKRHRQDKEQR